MKITSWILGVVVALPLAGTVARAQEKTDEQQHAHQKISMNDLPDAVRATVERESKGKTVEEISKEQRMGQTVYEVEVVSNGKGQEIEISDSGKVLNRSATHEEKNESEEQEKGEH